MNKQYSIFLDTAYNQKKMKNIIIIIVFYSQLLIAQNNIEVSYLIQYNTEIPNQRTGNLQIDFKQNKSLFLASKGNLKSEVTQKDLDIKVVLKGVEEYTIMDKNKDSLKSKKAIIYNTYLVCETIPVFKWDIENIETKKIGDYICKKAATSFRGRNYIAWYTLDFPTQFGPWKFNGLPGLIMEVYDETNRYHWTAQKIKTFNGEIKMPNDESNYTKIDLKKYVELEYESPTTSNNAQLPRGAFVVSTFKPSRNSMEIKFEWEE